MNDKVYEILRRSISNISQNYCDEYVEENAEFRSKAGVTTKIVRSTNGNCCKWCSSIAGIYNYPAPKEVYQRHDNCDCTVTFVSRKGAVDVWTKKNLKQLEFEDRLKKLAEYEVVMPDIFEDVKKEYFRNAAKDKGKMTIQEGVRKNKERKAIENAETLNEFFGHDIIILSEARENSVSNPDYLWQGKLWEQKTVSSAKAIDTALRRGMSQIQRNPGGIVLDITNVKEGMNEIYAVIADRIRRRNYDGSIDVILIEKEKIVSIIRHEKR